MLANRISKFMQGLAVARSIELRKLDFSDDIRDMLAFESLVNKHPPDCY